MTGRVNFSGASIFSEKSPPVPWIDRRSGSCPSRLIDSQSSSPNVIWIFRIAPMGMTSSTFRSFVTSIRLFVLMLKLNLSMNLSVFGTTLCFLKITNFISFVLNLPSRRNPESNGNGYRLAPTHLYHVKKTPFQNHWRIE